MSKKWRMRKGGAVGPRVTPGQRVQGVGDENPIQNLKRPTKSVGTPRGSSQALSYMTDLSAHLTTVFKSQSLNLQPVTLVFFTKEKQKH